MNFFKISNGLIMVKSSYYNGIKQKLKHFRFKNKKSFLENDFYYSKTIKNYSSLYEISYDSMEISENYNNQISKGLKVLGNYFLPGKNNYITKNLHLIKECENSVNISNKNQNNFCHISNENVKNLKVKEKGIEIWYLFDQKSGLPIIKSYFFIESFMKFEQEHYLQVIFLANLIQVIK